MSFITIKFINNNHYYYEQSSERIGGRVRSRMKYLGPVFRRRRKNQPMELTPIDSFPEGKGDFLMDALAIFAEATGLVRPVIPPCPVCEDERLADQVEAESLELPSPIGEPAEELPVEPQDTPENLGPAHEESPVTCDGASGATTTETQPSSDPGATPAAPTAAA